MCCQATTIVTVSEPDAIDPEKCYSRGNENWELECLGNGFYKIISGKSKRVLDVQNEIEKRERLMVEQISQNKITRLALIVGLLILSILVLVGLNRFRRQKQAWQLAEQEKELLRKEKELVEAREALKTKALVVLTQKLDSQERALEETNKQLNLKDVVIQELKMTLTANSKRKIEQIQDDKLQNLKILTVEDWRKFRLLFEQRYPDFISNLAHRFLRVTAAEIRLLMLIKIGFDAYEIADILGISTASVYKSRYRLRKKLGFVEEDDLEMFVNGF